LCALVVGPVACVQARVGERADLPVCNNSGDVGCCAQLGASLQPIADAAREYFVWVAALSCLFAVVFMCTNWWVTRFSIERADRLGRHGFWSQLGLPILLVCLAGPVSMAAESAILMAMGAVDKLTYADAQLRAMVDSQSLGSGVQCFGRVAGGGEEVTGALAWAASAAIPDARLLGRSTLPRFLVGGNPYLSALEQATLTVPTVFRIAEPLGALLGLIIGVYLAAKKNREGTQRLDGVNRDVQRLQEPVPTYEKSR
jgi:hypothetical protein